MAVVINDVNLLHTNCLQLIAFEIAFSNQYLCSNIGHMATNLHAGIESYPATLL